MFLNFVQFFILILCLQRSQTSLLSRMKNSYFYATTTDVVILPEDYNDGDDLRIFENIATRKLPLTYNERNYTVLIGKANVDRSTDIWRPVTKIKKPTPILTINTQFKGITDTTIASKFYNFAFKPRPTLPDDDFIRKTIELTLNSPKALHTKTWRTYFPTITNYNIDKFYEHLSMLDIPSQNSSIKYIPLKMLHNKNIHDTKARTAQTKYINAETQSSQGTININSNFYLPKKIFIKMRTTLRTRHEGKKIIMSKNNSRQGTYRCYTCGLNRPGLSTSECYDIFNSPDYRKRIKINRFKTKCTGDNLIGGCFKRYLDIGHTYYERGCRTMPPTMGRSRISKRLMKMEYLLQHEKDNCVVSPHAVLTPFSRDISLFARYHACVCSDRYCNKTSILIKPFYIINSLFVYLILINKNLNNFYFSFHFSD